MKTIGVMMLALAEIGTGSATGEQVSPQKLVAVPKSYLGKKIVVRDIPCIDQPRGRFLCLKIVNGETLKLEASVLGAKTKLEIAERLISECKGIENLIRPSCRVDAELQPTSAYKDPIDVDTSGKPIANLYGNEIEMYSPRKGR